MRLLLDTHPQNKFTPSSRQFVERKTKTNHEIHEAHKRKQESNLKCLFRVFRSFRGLKIRSSLVYSVRSGASGRQANSKPGVSVQ